MHIEFEIGGDGAVFRRAFWSGRAELLINDEVIPLQSPFRPSTHFQVSNKETWRHEVNDHQVQIEMTRPRAFGGLRAQEFIISVDGTVVAEATGR